MLMFRQVRPTIEFYPSRLRRPPVAHHKVADAGEVALPREFALARKTRVARRDFRIIPQELEHREQPLPWEEAALPQVPGSIGIFESIDGISKQGRVARIKDGIFVVPFA